VNIIKVYRILNWYYYLGFILIGLSINSKLNIDIIKHIFLGASLLAYAYSFNDFCDKHEKKMFFVLPLFLSLLLLPLFNFFQIIISLIFLIIVTFYSVYPFRWKTKPFIGSFCNGIGFTIIFLLGYSAASNIKTEGFLFSILFFSFNMVAQFIHEIVHLKEDKRSKIITTVVFLGEKNIKRFCYFLLFTDFWIGIHLFLLKALNILSFLSISFFTLFFIFQIRNKRIDISTRKRYKFLGIIIGIILFLSHLFNT
jgi:4-hydroxybenzoate polyprenyltransferase